MEHHKNKIRAFLSRHFQNLSIGDDEDIFALGFVNSLFAMELVMFVEKEFGIVVGNEDLEFENFSTVNALARFIERKTDRQGHTQPSTIV